KQAQNAKIGASHRSATAQPPLDSGSALHLQSASASAESKTTTAAKAAEHETSSHGIIMPLIRKHLYAPDGKPPASWDERREGSVLRELLKHRTAEQIGAAIE